MFNWKRKVEKMYNETIGQSEGKVYSNEYNFTYSQNGKSIDICDQNLDPDGKEEILIGAIDNINICCVDMTLDYQGVIKLRDTLNYILERNNLK